MFPNLLASGQMLGTIKYSALYKNTIFLWFCEKKE